MGKINHDPSVMVYIELNHALIPHPGPEENKISRLTSGPLVSSMDILESVAPVTVQSDAKKP